ncbi:DUF1934 domain-containing protein [Jeotgalibacillus malaysiensis]|uniref:DUF1934 domain-containing protein n=1 Tax=Jeotgalibacillus malaysiensis TaxID=1508404 RepID=A0A0B5AUY4_9BACL|nr:DUF1934 family protein [Jeotgalibacillus malaysiensis]AJD92403.1 hypothetical protein JMA_30860 [Jeotgalibacillus malaysiensis]
MENATPVSIHLTTVITQPDGSKEKLTLESEGEWIQKNNIDYLKYEEEQNGGTVRTIVKMEEDSAVILRSGAVKMRLAFSRGNKMMSSYESEHGTLSLLTNTKAYTHHTPGKKDGRFQITYGLEMQGSSVGTYKMTIDYKEAVQ